MTNFLKGDTIILAAVTNNLVSVEPVALEPDRDAKPTQASLSGLHGI
jgi:hypothetical protein